jgi:hypothetical protein
MCYQAGNLLLAGSQPARFGMADWGVGRRPNSRSIARTRSAICLACKRSSTSRAAATVAISGRVCLTRHKGRRRGASRSTAVNGRRQGLFWQGSTVGTGFVGRSSGSQQPLTLPRLSGRADRLVASRLGHGARFVSDLKA